MPVPYNLGFELAIISKNQEDGLQILEQILPYFQPHYNLSVKLLPSMNEVKDVPVVLQNIDYEDDYVGDFTQRRAVIYTFNSLLRHIFMVLLPNPRPSKRQLSITLHLQKSCTKRVRYQVTPTSLDTTELLLHIIICTADDNLIAVVDASGINKFDSRY